MLSRLGSTGPIGKATREFLPRWRSSRKAASLRLASATGTPFRACSRWPRMGIIAGIDISPTMVEEARRFNAKFLARGRAEFHCAGAERMPFPDASFDRAFSIGVIHFWPEPVIALRELRRVLKPGGFAILAALAPPATWDFARAEFGFYLRHAATWEALCRDAGFREVKAETVEVEQGAAGGAPVKINAARIDVRV